MKFSAVVGNALALAAVLTAGVEAKTFGERIRWNQKKSEEHMLSEANKAALLAARGHPRKPHYQCPSSDPFKVHSLPDVNFDIGEMYAGEIPIHKGNDSRTLFFVFAPKIGAPVDEITIWLNGGPGCSSLEGFFQENGPFTWQPGTFAPVQNAYSWTNLTNMLWVEQPVGTGFSLGTPTATSQEDISADFVSWFKNFQDTFKIKNHKIYVTGESYAGRYVPYISAAMLDKKDKEYYDLSGALVYDPCIGQFAYVQEQVPAVDLVKANANLFNFNATFMAQLDALNEQCGFANYSSTYYSFPPAGVQPYIPATEPSEDCDVFDLINQAALLQNPCFNIYEINQMCPLVWDVLGFPTELVYQSPGSPIYFNRSDVKAAIHAPQTVDWSECSYEAVFVGPDGSGPEGEGDLSLDPIQSVLPQVIEATQRVLVSNGNYDMIIITNGTLLAIQNMTWGGELGFQTKPTTPIEIMLEDLQYEAIFADNGLEGYDGPGQGIMGIQHYERGLMWAETFQSGHMQPQFQPRVAYRHMQWLLGHVDTL